MSIAHAGILVATICLLVSFSVASVRFWSRRTSSTRKEWSLIDSAIVMTLSFQIALFGVAMKLFMPAASTLYFEKLYFVGTFLYFGDLWSIKLSISLFHLRLTQRLGTAHTIAKCSLALMGLTFVIVVCMSLFECLPLSTRWDGTCNSVKQNIIFWVTVGFNITMDAILCIVPFPALRLITEKHIRVAVSAVFCLAGLVIVVSLIRAVLIYKNPSKNGSWIIITSHIEVTAGFVISSIPEMSKYFVKKYLQGTEAGYYGDQNIANSPYTQNQERRAAMRSQPTSGLREERSRKGSGGFIGLRGESASQRSKSEDERDVERDGVRHGSTDSIVQTGLSIGEMEAWPKRGITNTTTFEMNVL